MATKQLLTKPTEGITCHAWNADKSMIAICPNNNEIHIYGDCHTQKWNKLHVLGEHDLVVSGIDWSPVNNKIVSCSHDRNAFVWTFDAANNKWIPVMVILRIDRAAIDVKWSLDGMRFAVTSGSKCVPVCTYDPTNDWWVSKMVKKKIKSTVVCCAFHPTNGQLLATGSTDFKCRVFSTFASDVDQAPNAGDFVTPLEFGEAYCELSAHGWVNAVAWSPSGRILCYAGHDSSIHFATFSGSGVATHQTLRFRDLPLASLLFVSEKAVIGGGYDFNPLIFNTAADGNWKFLDRLDKKKQAAPASAGPNQGVAAARALFQSKTQRGQEADAEGDKLWTQHEGVITSMHSLGRGKLSTSGLDGRVVVWNIPELDIAMASLGL